MKGLLFFAVGVAAGAAGLFFTIGLDAKLATKISQHAWATAHPGAASHPDQG